MAPNLRPSEPFQPSRASKPKPRLTRLDDPGDVVVMVPYLLGFDPVDSLVLVALEGPRRRFGPCCRVDLVDGDDARDVRRQVAFLLALVARHGFGPLLLVAFSADAARADAVVRPLLAGLVQARVEVLEAVRADGRRWWSYTCTASCCGPCGTAYDPSSARVAAEAVLAGLSRAPDREALRRQFEPVGPARRALAAALTRSRTAAAGDHGDAGVSALVRGLLPVLGDSRRDLAELSAREQDTAAALLRAIQEPSGRDEAWIGIRRDDADQQFDLWRALMQSAPDALMAPAGALTAFAAWLSGRGVLASHAAERVLAVSPGHRMATLVLQLCDRSVNPGGWPAVVGGVVAAGGGSVLPDS